MISVLSLSFIIQPFVRLSQNSILIIIIIVTLFLTCLVHRTIIEKQMNLSLGNDSEIIMHI